MKIKYLTLLYLALCLISCKENAENSKSNSNEIELKTKEEMKQNSIIEFGKKYANAWSSQKPENVADFFASDASLIVNDGEPAIGSEAIIKVAKGFMDAFPDMVVTMDSLVSKSNKTRFYWTLTGTNTGLDGTGNKVKISGFEEWSLNKDRLVQESKGNFDEEDYNRQLKGDAIK